MCIESIIVTSYDSKTKNKFLHNKVFYDEELKQGLMFPYNSGIFNRCYDITGNHLQNIVLIYNQIQPGTYINVKILGGCVFTINGKIKEYIISVKCSQDMPHDIFDIKNFKLEQIKSFIVNYNKSKNNRVEFNRFINAERGMILYRDCVIRYNRTIEDDENKENNNVNLVMENRHIFGNN